MPSMQWLPSHVHRRRFLGTAAATAAALPVALFTSLERSEAVGDVNTFVPSLSGATDWLNTKPLTAAGLHGKVLIVQFWTYTCVNWLRTLPYVRAWADKYKGQGLVVVGVHTPEFGFEHNVDNIGHALKDRQISYPIAVDGNHAIWDAFGNQYWPALYLFDGRGHLRYQHFGEGDYEQAERAIQKVLEEAGARTVSKALVSVNPRGLEVAADWNDVLSAENFLGYERTEAFASPGGSLPNVRHVYDAPTSLKLNNWALSGAWTMGKEGVALNQDGGRIAYRFHARDVNLIMGPPSPGSAVRFRVLVDGRPPAAAHGDDASVEGYGSVTEQRTYQLIRQPKPIDERLFEIEFLRSGVEAFDFTFG